jgi:GNAT superfamily N-acetyltransferase
MSAMSASAHVSVLRRSPPPRALLASFSSPFARTRTDSNVTIRGASATDLPALANLCTDAFFGTHTFGDGPVIFAQRSAIYAKVFAQLARRIGIEDGREARLLVAVDPSTGALRGCVDLAVHLFDRLEQRFELTIDEMPENGRKRYSWLPYVASLAVSPESRRQGIARYALLRAAPCTPRALRSGQPPYGSTHANLARISHVSRTYLAGRAARMHMLTTPPPPFSATGS